MIPQEKSEAATRGLREAFGVGTFDDISELTKGRSGALVYRIVVRGSVFLLRIVMRTNDPTLPDHFTCMRAAAGAGLAPHVWYTSVEDRISITDFVETVHFPLGEARIRMPAALWILHALTPFPKRTDQLNTSCTFLMNSGAAVDGFMQRFQAANVLSRSETEQLFIWHAQLAAVYPRADPDMVSSHNDLFKPDNILFDGQRVWLVDWEAAFLNDRYADLAVVADLIDADERGYLHAYFGKPADDYQLARFVVMRTVVHLFYAMAFLYLGSTGERVDLSENVPDFRDLQRRHWAGEIDLSDKQMKTAYGKAHWKQLSEDMQQSRLREAMKIIAGRHVVA